VRDLWRNKIIWVGIAISVLFLYLSLRGVQMDQLRDRVREIQWIWLVPFSVVAVMTLLLMIRHRETLLRVVDRRARGPTSMWTP
jgi:uncharacterized membrane protein YbhN (UPF0104 family)